MWLSEVQTACHSDEGLIRVLSLGVVRGAAA